MHFFGKSILRCVNVLVHIWNWRLKLAQMAGAAVSVIKTPQFSRTFWLKNQHIWVYIKLWFLHSSWKSALFPRKRIFWNSLQNLGIFYTSPCTSCQQFCCIFYPRPPSVRRSFMEAPFSKKPTKLISFLTRMFPVFFINCFRFILLKLMFVQSWACRVLKFPALVLPRERSQPPSAYLPFSERLMKNLATP